MGNVFSWTWMHVHLSCWYIKERSEETKGRCFGSCNHNIPILHVLGLKGLFGTGLMSVLLIGMYFIPVGPKFGHWNPHHIKILDCKCFCKVLKRPIYNFHSDTCANVWWFDDRLDEILITLYCRHVLTPKPACSVHHLHCSNHEHFHVLFHCTEYYKDYG